jgi:hypothetical protein
MNQRHLGASVRQRLLDKARAEKRPFQELLQYCAMERFLYHLAQSPHAKRAPKAKNLEFWSGNRLFCTQLSIRRL